MSTVSSISQLIQPAESELGSPADFQAMATAYAPHAPSGYAGRLGTVRDDAAVEQEHAAYLADCRRNAEEESAREAAYLAMIAALLTDDERKEYAALASEAV